MRNFPLTHIAVSLLLIVVLAIQPIAICFASAACVADGSNPSTSTCQGCACCEVARSDDLCCCCRAPAQTGQKDEAESSCCSSNGKASAKSDSAAEELANESAGAIENATGVGSICLCEQDRQPLSDSSPRRPASENRVSLSIGSADLGERAWSHEQLLAATQYAAGVPIPTRFSQVVFCIWRL